MTGISESDQSVFVECYKEIITWSLSYQAPCHLEESNIKPDAEGQRLIPIFEECGT